jgi:hypothetical protein
LIFWESRDEKRQQKPALQRFTLMPQSNILSDHRVLSGTTYSKTPSDYLAGFERALSSFVQAWNKYQPDDSLSAERKQDLEWLQSTLLHYRLYIHSSSNRGDFWKGCRDGKHSRKTLADHNFKRRVQILLKAITTPKAHQLYELGVQVGWRYTRLKDYLLRIRKQRKLEQAQQLQDYQQFLNFIRQKTDLEDTDSFLSVGWV